MDVKGEATINELIEVNKGTKLRLVGDLSDIR